MNTCRWVYLPLTLVLAICPLVIAQHEHLSQKNGNIIDGAKHPELVPDSAAYRLFFASTSVRRDATTQERSQQRTKLEPIEMSDAELQVVVGILDQFKADYTDLIDRYNAHVVDANSKGIPPDFKGFLRDRDLLVETTRDTLRSALTPESLARFDAYVQGEKRHMLVDQEVQ